MAQKLEIVREASVFLTKTFEGTLSGTVKACQQKIKS